MFRVAEVMEMSGGSASSVKSDRSKEESPIFSVEPRSEQTRVDMKREHPASSVKSDRSKEESPIFSVEPRSAQTDGQTLQSPQQNRDTLKEFESKTITFVKQIVRAQRKVLSGAHEDLFEEEEQDDATDDPQSEVHNETREAALKIAIHVLRTMNEDGHARTLEQSHYGKLALYQKKVKSDLKMKNQCLLEGIKTQQWPVPLRKIYTKLYLLEGDSGQVNIEHEVRLIESAFNRRQLPEPMIRCEDIFKPLPDQKDKQIRVVLTKGIAGIGKTVLAQKFILDWSEGAANQDIQLLISLPCRELNLIRSERRTLMEFLHEFSPGLKDSGIKDLTMCRVLLLLDGLDECRLPLDFKGNEKCCDATQSASVDVLLTNLIAGNLLPKAYLWITTRPAAASLIPQKFIDRITEIRGFDNVQKEQYFYKKIEDEDLAKRVIANIRSSRSLYIMCHVPVFCWISSIVLGEMCAKSGRGKIPKTLTQMYIYFVIHQTTQQQVKYGEEQDLGPQGNKEVIVSLGKLAFQQLEKGNLIFYEEDLRECDIDVQQASVYSGVCTQVFREESCMQHKVFCFVHLSVQEFLAALYVHVTHKVHGVNLLVEEPDELNQGSPVSELHKAAVDRALKSSTGHLDLFLRFLLGLSLESNQGFLRFLQIEVETCPAQTHKDTTEYIREKLNFSLPPEKYINLFHCLNELNDPSLVEQVQGFLELDQQLLMDECSTAQWAALVFVLLTTPERPEEIVLKKYSRTERGLLRLLPAIKAAKSAMLDDCNLTAHCLEKLSVVLSSSCNDLIHLNLSDNDLDDSGIGHLCIGLQSPNCRLKTLRLNRCSLTPESCDELASVLSCPSSHLKELDLSHNDVKDQGVEQISKGLTSLSCKLESLRLSFCSITERSCGFLASAVRANPSHLSELDLSYNHLGESGVKCISDALEEERCEFTRLRVDHNAEHWFKPGLQRYACKLTLDPNTAHKLLVFSDDFQKVSQGSEEQPYPDHRERFDYWAQVLSENGLTDRHYWEVELEGKWAAIGVTYNKIGRKGPENDCVMGYNTISWSLHSSCKGYRAYHNFESVVIPVPPSHSNTLAVYLDWKAGILSFYRVSPGRVLTHLHTFFTKFADPLYPIFRLWGRGSSVRLCPLEPGTDELSPK
ncbi:uncharacterized protein V6R79_022592 [Siganus canaliculatus]